MSVTAYLKDGSSIWIPNGVKLESTETGVNVLDAEGRTLRRFDNDRFRIVEIDEYASHPKVAR